MCFRLFEAGQSDFERLVATDTGAHTGVSLQATPAIKVVGLPATASRQGIVDFLSGIEVLHGADSVTIISEQDASTSAVVQLANAAAQLQAISRSNTLFGERPVQVLPCDAVTGAAVSSSAVAGPSDPFAAQQSLISGSEQPVSAQQAQSFPFDTDGATLKLRGLPYSADETDVIAFFEGAITTGRSCTVNAFSRRACCLMLCSLHVLLTCQCVCLWLVTCTILLCVQTAVACRLSCWT